jgi:hypothetical protein
VLEETEDSVILVGGNGALTIGGGTAITEHLSTTFNPSFLALKPSTCATANFALTGASDGDTLALGVPSARMGGCQLLQGTAENVCSLFN